MNRHGIERRGRRDAGRATTGEGPAVDTAVDPVVDIVEVGHDVPGRPGILHDVSLAVARGEMVVVAGRSGSGKSTLCHLVAGVGRPTRGTVTVLGRPAHAWADWTRVSLLPQRLALVPELSVAENVAWPSLLAGKQADAAALLEALALDHIAAVPAAGSSLGEQQRTGLARALAAGPDLAVLDEPTGHQDDANVERVLAVLAARGPATAVLVATHDERLLAAADRVVTLDHGRVVPAASGVAAVTSEIPPIA